MSIYVASTANGYRPKFGTSSNLIELDAFIVENHTFSNSIQSHPVEKGSMVTDGVTANPTELELECTLSPFAIDVTKRANVTRADLGYRKLKSMFNAKTPVTVFTGLTTYHNMVISSISIPRNKETSKTLRFNINFRKVRIVGTTSFAIEELANPEDVTLDSVNNWTFSEDVVDKTAVSKQVGGFTKAQESFIEFAEIGTKVSNLERFEPLQQQSPAFAGKEIANKIDLKRSENLLW